MTTSSKGSSHKTLWTLIDVIVGVVSIFALSFFVTLGLGILPPASFLITFPFGALVGAVIGTRLVNRSYDK